MTITCKKDNKIESNLIKTFNGFCLNLLFRDQTKRARLRKKSQNCS